MRGFSIHFGALAPALSLALLAFVAGCAGDDTEVADASSERMTVVMPATDAAAGADGADAAPPETRATIRLANVSPDLGPVDFCWRLKGSATFTGPVLFAQSDAGVPADAATAGGDAAGDDAGDDAATADDGGAAGDAPGPPGDASEDGDAGAPSSDAAANPDTAPEDGASGGEDASDTSDATVGVDAPSSAPDASGADGGAVDAATDGGVGIPSLPFGAITGYLALPSAGTYDIALVEAGTVACRAPKLIASVTLQPEQDATVVVLGLASVDAGSESALSLIAFPDESPLDGQAHARIVNTALGWPDGGGPAPSLRVAIGGEVLAPQVDSKHFTSQSPDVSVDPFGYATVAPLLAPAALRLDAVGDDAGAMYWLSDPQEFGLLAGTVHSGFVVNRSPTALGMVWCGGAVASATLTATACTVIDAPLQ